MGDSGAAGEGPVEVQTWSDVISPAAPAEIMPTAGKDGAARTVGFAAEAAGDASATGLPRLKSHAPGAYSGLLGEVAGEGEGEGGGEAGNTESAAEAGDSGAAAAAVGEGAQEEDEEREDDGGDMQEVDWQQISPDVSEEAESETDSPKPAHRAIPGCGGMVRNPEQGAPTGWQAESPTESEAVAASGSGSTDGGAHGGAVAAVVLEAEALGNAVAAGDNSSGGVATKRQLPSAPVRFPLKNLDFLLKNVDFLLKNVDFTINQPPAPVGVADSQESAGSDDTAAQSEVASAEGEMAEATWAELLAHSSQVRSR